ncbi:MAG: SDR family NAD(P)-dependent oxidoreductase [Acidimicrobiales bacterium]
MTRSMLVTGAATGLGLAIASAAVDAEYRVGLLDIDPTVMQVASNLGTVGLVASVTEPAELDAALDEFGPIDVLINNAGIVRFGPLLDLTLDDWRAVVDVNLTGAFVAARAAAGRMAERGGGAIVNLTSMNGVAPGPNAGAYGSTKAAVALLTQQMALEWGPLGIRVNAVAPGLIDGGMSEPIYADPVTRAAREDKVPVGRLGRPGDVADVVLFLAGERADYITGQNLLVDGGVTMSMIANLPRPRSVDGVGGNGEDGVLRNE